MQPLTTRRLMPSPSLSSDRCPPANSPQCILSMTPYGRKLTLSQLKPGDLLKLLLRKNIVKGNKSAVTSVKYLELELQLSHTPLQGKQRDNYLSNAIRNSAPRDKLNQVDLEVASLLPPKEKLVSCQNLLLLLGHNGTNGTQKIMQVNEKHIHIRYDEDTGENNIALLQLQEHFECNNHHLPVCIPERDFAEHILIPKLPGTVSGWRMEGDGLQGNELQVSYLPAEDCKQILNISLTNRQFCGHLQEAVDKRLAGGSFLATEYKGTWFLTGILGSWPLEDTDWETFLFTNTARKPGITGMFFVINFYSLPNIFYCLKSGRTKHQVVSTYHIYKNKRNKNVLSKNKTNKQKKERKFKFKETKLILIARSAEIRLHIDLGQTLNLVTIMLCCWDWKGSTEWKREDGYKQVGAKVKDGNSQKQVKEADRFVLVNPHIPWPICAADHQTGTLLHDVSYTVKCFSKDLKVIFITEVTSGCTFRRSGRKAGGKEGGSCVVSVLRPVPPALSPFLCCYKQQFNIFCPHTTKCAYAGSYGGKNKNNIKHQFGYLPPPPPPPPPKKKIRRVTSTHQQHFYWQQEGRISRTADETELYFLNSQIRFFRGCKLHAMHTSAELQKCASEITQHDNMKISHQVSPREKNDKPDRQKTLFRVIKPAPE
ncbi:hypothetical protein QYF61_025667 [Mycteria americana]|uniref:Peptidase S1 domain-containing protein n=1 Tax=Mycteria americana TaxID=33587 RepID=A0AAN7NXD1_MYCAM|nr:hypothetical protein QYF61_025667 [Mycteria americana]